MKRKINWIVYLLIIVERLLIRKELESWKFFFFQTQQTWFFSSFSNILFLICYLTCSRTNRQVFTNFKNRALMLNGKECKILKYFGCWDLEKGQEAIKPGKSLNLRGCPLAKYISGMDLWIRSGFHKLLSPSQILRPPVCVTEVSDSGIVPQLLIEVFIACSCFYSHSKVEYLWPRPHGLQSLKYLFAHCLV